MNRLLVDFNKNTYPTKKKIIKIIEEKKPKIKKTKDIKAYYRAYYYKNKEIIKQRSREYKENNRDLVKLKSLEYRMIHVDEFKQRFICLCGSNILKKSFSVHCKSIKHKQFIKSFLSDN